MTMIGLSNAQILAALLGMLVIAIFAAAGVVAVRYVRASRAASDQPEQRPERIPKLSSDALAGLIAQALIDSKIIESDQFDEAARVAARKIDLRKALGDY